MGPLHQGLERAASVTTSYIVDAVKTARFVSLKGNKLNYNTTQQVGSDSRLPKSLLNVIDIQVA